MTLYGALHIVCQHVCKHNIALCALGDLSAGIPPVSVSAQLWVARLVMTRGLGAYCPQYVLTVFLFAGFSSVKYVLPVYVGLGPKLHTCILLQFMCITCLWMQLVISDFILSISQIKYLISVSFQQVYFSIDIFRFSFCIFRAL